MKWFFLHHKLKYGVTLKERRKKKERGGETRKSNLSKISK